MGSEHEHDFQVLEKAALTISLEDLEEDALLSEQKRSGSGHPAAASKPRSQPKIPKIFGSKKGQKRESEEGTEMVEKTGGSRGANDQQHDDKGVPSPNGARASSAATHNGGVSRSAAREDGP
mmetsp:Transcript_42210/g.84891  ORF Transcript_42210/g.84891 Transcript_42210/m.84891 type:complete len:122 (+) Transcript_42210:42-407(+)